jgi:hypothetical protein
MIIPDKKIEHLKRTMVSLMVTNCSQIHTTILSKLTDGEARIYMDVIKAAHDVHSHNEKEDEDEH